MSDITSLLEPKRPEKKSCCVVEKMFTICVARYLNCPSFVGAYSVTCVPRTPDIHLFHISRSGDAWREEEIEMCVVIADGKYTI